MTDSNSSLTQGVHYLGLTIPGGVRLELIAPASGPAVG